MARSATGAIKVQVEAKITNSDTNAGDVTFNINDAISNLFNTSGTGDDQFDRLWFDKGRAVTSASSEDIDVYDLAAFDAGFGAGADALGQTVTFAEITGIVIKNYGPGVLICGNKNTAAAFQQPFNSSDTGAVSIPDEGIFVLTAPKDGNFTVTDTSDHLLTVTASGGNITYDVYLFGRSA